ncbi:cyclin-T1-like isoform X2 [Lethenteron reissneri]|uniref:cyclin-T1-like isoform X2 n=1 Tax=Lethenteron reissneri TaxID=7753 RepID=UPI002AB7EA97|nr:cyclin-T1-like isoform X2 [Lethenteron reissneri]
MAAAPPPPPPAKWFFSREQLEATPSRRCGIEVDKELSYRQQAANLIQDMGQRLNVSQLTINTAIVYMHRFYMLQTFSKFHRNAISPAALFLAAKVEEQPRKLEHVIKVAHACLNPQEAPLDTKSDAYLQQAQDLVMNEHVMLQTLGFEITIDHPHTYVVKCTQLVRASKDLAQTSYFMATNSLHLTTFCLQHKPTVVACVCIHLACKWSNWEIPVSSDGKPWWEYVDNGVSMNLLDALTHEFLQILEKTPNRLKRIRNWKAYQNQAIKKLKVEGQPTNDAHCHSLDSLAFHFDAADLAAPSEVKSASTSVPQPISVPMVPVQSVPFAPPGQVMAPLKSYQLQKSHDLQQKTHDSVPIKVEMQAKHSDNAMHSDVPVYLKTERSSQKLPSRDPQPSTATGSVPSATANKVPHQKVSLLEYQEKHAVVLAEHKRKLERQEAELKEKYASEAQILLEVQRREKMHQQQQSSGTSTPSEQSQKHKHKSHHQSNEKVDKHGKQDKSSIKVRLPGNQDDTKDGREIKVKIKMPMAHEHNSGTDDSISKGKHQSQAMLKEKHKDHHPASHHHHHHGNSHKHLHSYPHLHSSGNGKHSSDGSKGGFVLSPEAKPGTTSSSGSSSSGSSRKRPRESNATSHGNPQKMSKQTSKSSSSFAKQHSFAVQSLLHLPMPPPPPTTSISYGQLSKRSGKELNGLNSDSCLDLDEPMPHMQGDSYKATRDMLESLLCAQGVNTPTNTSQSGFTQDFSPNYYSQNMARGFHPLIHRGQSSLPSKPPLPPLPADPPPPPPPLPK